MLMLLVVLPRLRPSVLRVSLWLLLRQVALRPVRLLRVRRSLVLRLLLVVLVLTLTRGHWRLLVLERLRPTVSV